MVRAVLRIVGFEVKGLAAIAAWIVRRRHGVPDGAAALAYGQEQAFMLGLMSFAMAVETVVVDLLLAALGVPAWLRYGVLIADLYGLLYVLMLAAGCATRPHVVTADELRVRYGVYLDLRVPRELVAGVRTGRAYHQGGMITVEGGRLTVAVSSQTNVTVELAEPVTVVRPLGRRAEVTSVRFFAQDPEAAVAALKPGITTRTNS